MDRLRQMVANILKQFGPLRATHKLLIASLVVIALMTMFVVVQYTGKSDLREVLPGAPAEEQQRALTLLANFAIDGKMQNGAVMVPAADEIRAREALLASGEVGKDKAILFQNILQKQSWTNSRQQNDRLYAVALQNELARTIASMKGVKTAQVFLDIPEPGGLGGRVKKPRAAVTVETDTGAPVTQGMADAVAGLVAGASAGLELDAIRIIDSSGRQMRARSEEDQLPATYMEHATRVETQVRQKALDLLEYIPGVVVAVTAQVDVTRVTSQETSFSPESKGTVALEKERTKITNDSSEGSAAAVPGVEANQTADITRMGSGGGGNVTRNEETTIKSENYVGSRTQNVLDPKGYPTLVAVSVNVPRSFVASLIKTEKEPEGGGNAGAGTDSGAGGLAGPTDQQVDDKFATVLKPLIIESLVPQVRALMVQGEQSLTAEEIKKLAGEMISVAMIPLDIPMAVGGVGGSGSGAGLTGMTGMASSLGGVGGMVDKAVLGVLAIVAMTMMVTMVRRASKRGAVPTAEELVGLPPMLDPQNEVIGEAESADAALAGIEMNDDALQSQQVLGQVGDMIKSDPAMAARLLARWIDVEN